MQGEGVALENFSEDMQTTPQCLLPGSAPFFRTLAPCLSNRKAFGYSL